MISTLSSFFFNQYTNAKYKTNWNIILSLGLPSAHISYIPAAVGLQTPTLTPAGEQRSFEYPLTPQGIPTGGPIPRDSLLQRSQFDHGSLFSKN